MTGVRCTYSITCDRYGTSYGMIRKQAYQKGRALFKSRYYYRHVTHRQGETGFRPLGEELRRFVSTSASNEEELNFTEYKAEINSAYWETRPVAVTQRLVEVGASLGSWFATGSMLGESPQERASRLKRILTQLGPAYIKIGQAISSRPDVLSPVFLGELEKLQDRLPPFSTDEALKVIEEEYGKSPDKVFQSLSPEPVAAASLGQVYKGILYDGTEVAVKVQRPGVAKSISLDVLVLRRLAIQVRAWRKLNTNLPLLIDEWAASLFKELDYRQEAQNGIKFKELYSHLDGVYVPKMYSELTTRRVLVMEWIDGERLSSATAGSRDVLDDIRLVEVGVRCSLEQLLEYGFYHADPHPGNLLRTRDGKLAYLDFGMVGEVDEKIRRGLIRATLHLVNREYQSLADDFITLGMLPEDSDKEKIVPALTGVFAEALAGGVNNLSFGDLSSNLGRTMYEFKFQIPSYYTLLVRSMSVLEGIALRSDPNYKVLASAYPWVARRLLTDTSSELRDTLLALLYKDGKLNFKRMQSLLTQSTRSTGLPQRPKGAPEGSPPPRGDALALLLSPKANFIRDIVINELGKGTDAAWRVSVDSIVMGAYNELYSTMVSSGDPQSLPFLRNILEFLTQIPKLSDDEDVEQIDGLQALVQTLQKTSAAQQASSSFSTGGETEAKEKTETSSRCTLEDQIQSFVSFVEWSIKEAQTLDQEERLQAAKLPFDVAQNASNRIIARAVRWFFTEESTEESQSRSPTTVVRSMPQMRQTTPHASIQKRYMFGSDDFRKSMFRPKDFGV
ncbi:aarF domain-containing protein kinase [Picochlorum sp. SENEW3]|nr:aarF domain-containing protein kinase [Picochlorum sp. SENEW3]